MHFKKILKDFAKISYKLVSPISNDAELEERIEALYRLQDAVIDSVDDETNIDTHPLYELCNTIADIIEEYENVRFKDF